jgi:hypothetical protein
MNFCLKKAEKILGINKLKVMNAIKTNHTGSWNSHKTKLRKRFTNLTEQDLNYEKGKSDEMFIQLMLKLGKSRKEMAAIVALFYSD